MGAARSVRAGWGWEEEAWVRVSAQRARDQETVGT